MAAISRGVLGSPWLFPALKQLVRCGAVRCDQPRVLDVQARNGRKVDTLPAALMDEVLAKVATIFE